MGTSRDRARRGRDGVARISPRGTSPGQATRPATLKLMGKASGHLTPRGDFYARLAGCQGRRSARRISVQQEAAPPGLELGEIGRPESLDVGKRLSLADRSQGGRVLKERTDLIEGELLGMEALQHEG